MVAYEPKCDKHDKSLKRRILVLRRVPPGMTETVRPEWVDYNGHMNMAYYVLIFDHGTDAFLERIGMNARLRDETGSSVFVAEAHVTYEAEVMEGERVRIATHLIDHDEKRLHLFHEMFGADDALAATNELMILQVNLNDRRVGPFPEGVRKRIAQISDEGAAYAKPAGLGRVIAIPRRH
jgi:acyl-CoA thioester hydrolase